MKKIALYIRTSSKSTYNKTSAIRQKESIIDGFYSPQGEIFKDSEYTAEVYMESCKDSTPLSKRSQLASLLLKIKHNTIDYVLVESFDRLSRSFELLSEIRGFAKKYKTPIISMNTNKDIRNYTLKELKMYSDFLMEEKKLLILKLKSLKTINKNNNIYPSGRKAQYHLNFKEEDYKNLWETHKLYSLTLREIQSILFKNNYTTINKKPLSLGTISKLRDYYIKNILI